MWSLLITLILQDHMSKRKANPSSLTGLRGHSVDIHAASNQTARLVSNSFLPAKYLECVDEVVDTTDNVVDNTTSYSLSRDLVDSFSGYSSLLSWNHEDEFELEASSRVQAMFHDINSALFDRTKTGSTILDHECDEWSNKYPHIRVNGVQLMESEDEGMEYFVPDPFVVNRYLLEGLSLGQYEQPDLFQLCVYGHQIKPLSIPPSIALAITSCKRDKRNIIGPYEELIASDGIVEEYFAFDATGEELIGSSHGKGRRANKKRGLPPITPNACVKDTVGSQVFDLVWAEVVVILKPLLQAVGGGASGYINKTPSPTLDAPTNLIGRSQLQDLQNFKQPMGGASAVEDDNIASLQGLMKIKPLPLQTRQPPIMARCHTSFASHDHVMSDGNDQNNLLLGNQDQYGLIRTNRYTPLPGSRPDTMATGRLISGSWNRRNMATLKPLDKPRTPANLDDGSIDLVCLRGQRIASMNGTTPSWARSGQLPPLEDIVFDKRSPPPIRSSAHKARSTGLASRMTITGLENSSHSDIQQILCITSNDAATSLQSDTPKIPPPPSRRHSNHLSYSHTPLKMIGHTPGYYAPPLDEDEVTDNVAWGVTSNSKPQSTNSKHRLRGIIR